MIFGKEMLFNIPGYRQRWALSLKATQCCCYYLCLQLHCHSIVTLLPPVTHCHCTCHCHTHCLVVFVLSSLHQHCSSFSAALTDDWTHSRFLPVENTAAASILSLSENNLFDLLYHTLSRNDMIWHCTKKLFGFLCQIEAYSCVNLACCSGAQINK